jgi:hypothetical protein
MFTKLITRLMSLTLCAALLVPLLTGVVHANEITQTDTTPSQHLINLYYIGLPAKILPEAGELTATERLQLTASYASSVQQAHYNHGDEINNPTILDALKLGIGTNECEVKVYYLDPLVMLPITKGVVYTSGSYRIVEEIILTPWVSWGTPLSGIINSIKNELIWTAIGDLSKKVSFFLPYVQPLIGNAMDVTKAGTVKHGTQLESYTKEVQNSNSGYWKTYYTAFGEKHYRSFEVYYTNSAGYINSYTLWFTPGNTQGLSTSPVITSMSPNYSKHTTLVSNATKVYANNMGYSYEDARGVHWGDAGE